MNKQNLHAFTNVLFVMVLILAGSASGGPSPANASSPREALLACAAPSDACWENGYHLPGVIGTVYAIAQAPNGSIYVGGEIISAGGMPVNNLAMWDGAAWRDVGGGVTYTGSYTPKVHALAVDASNNLFVGGDFNQAGSVAASSLAKWNGSNWEAIGGGTDGSVMVIKAVSGGIYIGGYFSQAGGIAANNIAYRDFQSATWVSLGSGPYNGVDDTVYAIEYEPTSNSWFIGGEFFNAGGVPAVGLAHYLGGDSWEAVGGGLSAGGNVNALLRVARDGGGYSLYVGGAFPQVGAGVSAYNIALWDGSSWSALSYGTDGVVNALLQMASGELIVAGDFSTAGSSPGIAVKNIARWGSGAWSALGSGLGTESFEEVNALLLSGSDIIASGDFDLAGSQVVNNLAMWNGSWAAFGGGLGINNVVNTLLPDGDSLYATGYITRFGSLQADGLAKLSASAWSGEGSPAYHYIRALAKNGSTLYAGGAFNKSVGNNADHLAYWDGIAWQELAGGTNGYVNALALGSGSKLYVGGDFTDVGDGNAASHIAMWDGTWHTLGEGLDGSVSVLAFDASGNLYAGGAFNYAGSRYVSHIAMWDGSAWRDLGSGVNSSIIESIVFDGDNRLYAGGCFGNAGGVGVNGVAMYNGFEWSALGSGMDNCVSALAVDSSGYLYAGGDFHTAGGVTANHIARWDGFAWSALGSGADSNVFELAAVGSERLYAGGVFKMAGGKPASYLAAYTLPTTLVSAPPPQLTSLAPASVFAGGTGFWLWVYGSDFSSRSVVRYNGDTLLTTYIDSGRLKAYVPYNRVASAGTATIIVFTPAPSGGGASIPRSLEIVDRYHVFLPVINR